MIALLERCWEGKKRAALCNLGTNGILDLQAVCPTTLNKKAKDIAEVEKKIFEKVKEIESSDFKCSKSVLCLNCEYKMLCNVNR